MNNQTNEVRLWLQKYNTTGLNAQQIQSLVEHHFKLEGPSDTPDQELIKIALQYYLICVDWDQLVKFK